MYVCMYVYICTYICTYISMNPMMEASKRKGLGHSLKYLGLCPSWGGLTTPLHTFGSVAPPVTRVMFRL